MKERITFIQPATAHFSPEKFKISTHGLRIESLEAAKESRLTFGVEELPHDVRYIFLTISSHGRWHANASIDSSSSTKSSSISSSMGRRESISFSSPFSLYPFAWFASLLHSTLELHIVCTFILVPFMSSIVMHLLVIFCTHSSSKPLEKAYNVQQIWYGSGQSSCINLSLTKLGLFHPCANYHISFHQVLGLSML